jgi:hypothetical protein
MTFSKFSEFLTLSAVVLLVCAALCPSLRAQALVDQTLLEQGHGQGPAVDAPTPLVEASMPVVTRPSLGDERRFWDKQNCALFVAAAALNGADFAVTRANLQSGGQELNPMVRVFGRSTAGLALNFIGETAGVVSISYFLHKTGHHKLERMVSMVNIGSSGGALSYSLMHR